MLAASSAARADPPTVTPGVSVGVDVVRRHAVDVAVGVDSAPMGFNMVPAMVTSLATSITLADTRVIAQVAYGQAVTDTDRYGDAQLTALHPLTARVALGAGSRLSFDLEDDPVEPTGEKAWVLATGPVARVELGRIALGAMTGLTAWREHAAASERVGAIAELGLASRF